jgi:hypothetical protein
MLYADVLISHDEDDVKWYEKQQKGGKKKEREVFCLNQHNMLVT